LARGEPGEAALNERQVVDRKISALTKSGRRLDFALNRPGGGYDPYLE
jgi:hypothetical protein